MLLNDSLISLIVYTISVILTLLLLLLFGDRLFIIPIANKLLVITAICLTVLSPFLFSSVFDHSIFSARVFEVFLFQLLSSIIILFATFFLLKNYISFITRKSDEINEHLSNKERRSSISYVREPRIFVKLSDNELNLFVDCILMIDLRDSLDKKSYVNIIRMILLAQEAKDILLEDLIYAVDSLIHPDLCPPEKAVKLMSVIQKYSTKIAERPWLSIQRKVISNLVPKLNMLNLNEAENILDELVSWRMATVRRDLKSSLRSLSIKSREEYEANVHGTVYVYFEPTSQMYLLNRELAKRKVLEGILFSGDLRRLRTNVNLAG